MSIEVTPDNLLIQMGYTVNDATLKQIKAIMDSTPGFDKFSKHIFTLIDEVKRFDGVVALSNSKDVLKVKSHATEKEEIDAFNEYVQHWADKYKVELQKVDGKNTYYILGHK